MELYKEILAHALAHEDIRITITGLEVDASKIVQLACYKAFLIFKAVIEDDSLEDQECFMKIEEIVCAFEELGSNGGGRHDLG